MARRHRPVAHVPQGTAFLVACANIGRRASWVQADSSTKAVQILANVGFPGFSEYCPWHRINEEDVKWQFK
jgi:hypothetical protein